MKKKSFLAYPYIIWSAIFIVIPLILVVLFSFTQKIDGKQVFSIANYRDLMDPIYFKVFLISKVNVSKRGTLILLFILPMWMNFLLRTYAWVAILGKNGLLNTFLGWFGIPHTSILYTNTAILLGMVYNFLPFMVLPIFNSLSKMDNDLINAARDLGANSFQVFTKVIFPLSLPGVVSGITMVFMPAVTTFAISRLLGGGKFMLIGDLIEQQFTVVGDWNFGSAVSIFMMIIILISMAVMSRFEDESDKEGGGLLF